ncbi:hypothetical protein SAY87_009087 [Trapa incisa]|uniref:WRKY domain-containing protein n=1 Tax=Trapa incisa TaxID=236973 RepID=A0AAN7Q1Y7_9MYRT|nr:hypothetical protein SAY87_009087 [Trapa incisa]
MNTGRWDTHADGRHNKSISSLVVLSFVINIPSGLEPSFASDHHQEDDQQAARLCSDMAFFSNNFTSPAITFTPSSFQSAHDRNIISSPTWLSVPNTDLSSSSPSSVASGTLLSSSSCATTTAAPLHESPTTVIMEHTQNLSLQADRTSPASANNFWAWSELNHQSLLSSNKLTRSGHAGTIIGASTDHSHRQERNPNSNNNRLGVSGMKMKRIKGRKVREPRFCFKTLSDVDVLDDGYKWRKYGQKVVKKTQHPRSYYRCTQDNCRVKKKVERLAEDPRMVITTYEGRHAHSPLMDTDESQVTSNSHLSDFFRYIYK